MSCTSLYRLKALLATSVLFNLTRAQSVGVVTDISANLEGVIETSIDVATFLPTTFAGFETLSSTIHTAIGMATSTSMYSYEIGPGGVGWTLPSASGGVPPLPQPPLPSIVDPADPGIESVSALDGPDPGDGSSSSSASVLSPSIVPSDSQILQTQSTQGSTTPPIIVPSSIQSSDIQPTQRSPTPSVVLPSDTQSGNTQSFQESTTPPIVSSSDTQSANTQSTQESTTPPVILPSDTQTSELQTSQDSTSTAIIEPSDTQSSNTQPTESSTTLSVIPTPSTQALESQTTEKITSQQSQESDTQKSQESTTQQSQESTTQDSSSQQSSSQDSSSQDSTSQQSTTVPPVVIPSITKPPTTQPTEQSSKNDQSNRSDDSSKNDQSSTSGDSSKSDDSSKSNQESSTSAVVVPTITEPTLTRPIVPTEISKSGDCTASAVSDCIVSCATSTSNSCASFTTTCTQTSTGCDIQGMTTTVSTSVCVISPPSNFAQATATGCKGDCGPDGEAGTAFPPYSSFEPSATSDDPDLRVRALAGRITMGPMEKRAQPSAVSILGGCRLNTPPATPLQQPGWPRATADILNPDLNTALPQNLASISRYHRATVDGCAFTTTSLNASDFQTAPSWKNWRGLDYNNANNEVTMDHAYEKAWLLQFFNFHAISSTGAPGALTCNEANQYFFPTLSGCQDNYLAAVFNELASDQNLRFIVMSGYLNNIAKSQFFPESGQQFSQPFVNDPNYVIGAQNIANWKWPSNSQPFSARDSLNRMVEQFERVLYGVLEMNSDNMQELIQKTNNAIYFQLQNYDLAINSNPGNKFGNTNAYATKFGPNGLPGAYRTFMTDVVEKQINDPVEYLTQLWEDRIFPMIHDAYDLPGVNPKGPNPNPVFYKEWEKYNDLATDITKSYLALGVPSWEYRFRFEWNPQNRKRDQHDLPGACPIPKPSSSSGSVEAPKPTPAYAPGTCSFHLDEYETCDSDLKNLFADITLKDNAGTVIGQSSPLLKGSGQAINANAPMKLDSKLPFQLEVTGEHKGDYIQFSYNGQSWRSNGPPEGAGGAQCTSGGWDPKKGPSCLLDQKKTAKRQMDCTFHC
ncbi:MAG: hypothetical protein M1820_003613 [Bogoriella megaspora]|nr:MAG: hypothetical protein M1820_003613 [Bogoriella megaspora]